MGVHVIACALRQRCAAVFPEATERVAAVEYEPATAHPVARVPHPLAHDQPAVGEPRRRAVPGTPRLPAAAAPCGIRGCPGHGRRRPPDHGPVRREPARDATACIPLTRRSDGRRSRAIRSGRSCAHAGGSGRCGNLDSAAHRCAARLASTQRASNQPFAPRRSWPTNARLRKRAAVPSDTSVRRVDRPYPSRPSARGRDRIGTYTHR